MVARALLARGLEAYLGRPWLLRQRRLHAFRRKGRRRFDVFLRLEDGHAALLAQVLPDIARAADADLRTWLIPPPPLTVDPEPGRRRAWTIDDAALLAEAHPELSFPAHPKVPTDDAIAAAERALAERGWEAYVDVATALLAGESISSRAEAGSVETMHQRGFERLKTLGHYQPAMVHYEGEWYWGLDRLWHLTERLRDEGLDVNAPVPKPVVAKGEGPLVTYFSFRSPYSYLGVARLGSRPDVELRPVLPMVMRGYRVPRIKRFYLAKDAAREAHRWGVPFGRLVDPLGPGIERCIATFFATPANQRMALTQSIMQGIWSEGIDVGRGSGLEKLVRRAGVAWTEPDLREDAPWRATVARHREELGELGLWGVPSFHREPTRLWGQDRLPWL